MLTQAYNTDMSTHELLHVALLQVRVHVEAPPLPVAAKPPPITATDEQPAAANTTANANATAGDSEVVQPDSVLTPTNQIYAGAYNAPTPVMRPFTRDADVEPEQQLKAGFDAVTPANAQQQQQPVAAVNGVRKQQQQQSAVHRNSGTASANGAIDSPRAVSASSANTTATTVPSMQLPPQLQRRRSSSKQSAAAVRDGSSSSSGGSNAANKQPQQQQQRQQQRQRQRNTEHTNGGAKLDTYTGESTSAGVDPVSRERQRQGSTASTTAGAAAAAAAALSSGLLTQMDTLYDTLELLGYQRFLMDSGRSPVTRLHFALEHGGVSNSRRNSSSNTTSNSGPSALTRRGQFLDFLAAAQWLISALSSSTNTAQLLLKGEEQVPAVAAMAALRAAQGVGLPAALTAAVTPVGLTSGFGEGVLTVLCWLSAELLQQRRSRGTVSFELQYSPRGADNADVAEGDSPAVDDEADAAEVQSEVSAEDCSGEHGTGAAAAGAGSYCGTAADSTAALHDYDEHGYDYAALSMSMLVATVDPLQWRLEQERVALLLQQRAAQQQQQQPHFGADWSARIDALHTAIGSFRSAAAQGSAVDSQRPSADVTRLRGGDLLCAGDAGLRELSAVAAAASEQRAGVSHGERRVNSAHSSAQLISAYRELHAQQHSCEQAAAALQQSIAVKAAAAADAEADVAAAVEAVALRADAASGMTALRDVKEGIARLRSDVQELDAKISITSARLWQRQRCAAAAAAAAGSARLQSAKRRQRHHDDSLSGSDYGEDS
jgi:Intra-flagellar transport protein 57